MWWDHKKIEGIRKQNNSFVAQNNVDIFYNLFLSLILAFSSEIMDSSTSSGL